MSDRAVGSTNNKATIRIYTASGVPAPALALHSNGTAIQYKPESGTPVTITLTGAPTPNYVDRGDGYYEVNVPDAAYTSAVPRLTIGGSLAGHVIIEAIHQVRAPYLTDKAGYSLAADQAVNVTKVGGTAVAGPNDLKADVSGLATTAALTLLSNRIPDVLVNGRLKALSTLEIDQPVNVVKVGGTAVAGPNDLKADVSGLAASVWNYTAGSGRTLSSNVVIVGGYAVGVTAVPPETIAAIQTPILAAIAVIAPGAADYAIRLEVKYQGNGVANAKVALAGTTAAAFTDSNGVAQLNVSANATYTVRLTPPDGYQFVSDFAVQVLTADVTVPITLTANSLPAAVPPLRVTYDEIRRHVGRFLGFGANPDQFEASQSMAVDDTIRQGLRDVYFPSINGAPYEWSFLKRYTELQFSGGSTFALPTSFVRLASQLTVPGLGYPLRQVSESALRSMAVDSTEQGPPIYYALSADGDSLDLGVTLYRIRLFPVPPAGGHAEFWYHISPEIDLNEGGPLGGIDLASTIIECCLARAELAQNVESISQGGGIHMARSQEMLRRSIEADRALQSATLAVSMADQMRPPQ